MLTIYDCVNSLHGMLGIQLHSFSQWFSVTSHREGNALLSNILHMAKLGRSELVS